MGNVFYWLAQRGNLPRKYRKTLDLHEKELPSGYFWRLSTRSYFRIVLRKRKLIWPFFADRCNGYSDFNKDAINQHDEYQRVIDYTYKIFQQANKVEEAKVASWFGPTTESMVADTLTKASR